MIKDFNNKRFFVTNDIGFLKKLNIGTTPFVFPVGFDKNTYNPLTITEKGIADDYSVRCLEYALLNGAAGNSITTGGINVSWLVAQGTGGGANATIKAQWKNIDELTGFNYYECMVTRYTANGWDYKANQADTANGNTYRNISRSGFANLGYFTVLSDANPTFTNRITATANGLAVNLTNNKQQMSVYPTIVQHHINIAVPLSSRQFQKMNITLLDGAGKTAWQKQNADYMSQKLFLPDLPPGMYHVLIESDGEKFVQKIIIAK